MAGEAGGEVPPSSFISHPLPRNAPPHPMMVYKGLGAAGLAEVSVWGREGEGGMWI